MSPRLLGLSDFLLFGGSFTSAGVQMKERNLERPIL